MNSKVFYSWQSDLPNSTNRGFIQDALEKAAKAIRNDDSLDVEPVIDRDVQGVAGSPDIGLTIFSKIQNAAVFVCDVSIINPKRKKDERPTPNPNVLIELGYALNVLGHERIIMVMNTAYGKPEFLPFDLRQKLVLSYFISETDTEKAPERKKLEVQILGQLITTFKTLEAVPVAQPLQLSPAELAIQAINDGKPNQKSLVRNYMMWLGDQITTLNPDLDSNSSNDIDELLILALEESIDVVVEFAKLAHIAVTMQSKDSIKIIYEGFTHILKHYTNPRGFSGHFMYSKFDFYKFIGHELFVILISFLIQEDEWDLIGSLLDEEIFVDNLPDGNQGTISFPYISQYVWLLNHRNDRLGLNQVSIHADLLNDRHSKPALADLVTMQNFIDADVLLYFCSISRKKIDDRFYDFWRAWSIIHMEYTYVPNFLSQAQKVSSATKLLRPMKLNTVEELREFLVENTSKLGDLYRQKMYHFSPLSYFNPNSVGTA